MNCLRAIGFLLLVPAVCLSQSHQMPKKFWQPMSINGALKLGAEYRYEVGTTNEIYNYQETPLAYGGILLNTNSYFWHPNFLTLDLGGEFNPELRQEYFLVIPDRAEARTVARVDATATFFQQKPITFSLFTNYNESYTSRENLSNVKITALNFGGNLSWANKILPVKISYVDSKWDEHEIQTGRTFITYQKMLQGIINKSFSKRDKNELIYFHHDYRRQDPNFIETRNISDNFNLNNSYSIDPERKYVFTSLISGTDQKGTDTFKRLQAYENLSFQLPANLRFAGNYNYSNIYRPSQQVAQHNVNTALSHQLFNSLNTSIGYEYNNVSHTSYHEVYHKYGIDLRYEKSIPKGRLFLSYSYYRQNQMHTSESILVQILDEQHKLTDGAMELLDKSYVLPETVVVTDITGTIFYQPLLDYILISRNTFIEIQRIPGGQIANNVTVMVDYMVRQPGDYKYDVNYMNFNASVQFFNRLVELYYRRFTQDYANLENTEFLTLNYVTQNIYGARLEYKFASIGAEYEDYNSSVIPYNLWTYYFQLQGTIKERLLCSLNGNLKDYHLLYNDTYQRYADLAGNFAWVFSAHTRLSLEMGYRKQIGEGIDLDLITARTEFTANYRKLFFKVGGEYYRRIYLAEQMNYYGAYVEVVRTFGWNKR
jgi:hypothetical protein